MTDVRDHNEGHPEDTRIDDDLRALGAASRRYPRSLTTVLNRAATEGSPRTREDGFMASIGFRRGRHGLAALGVAAVVVLALLVVPISYTKTVGHEVALHIGGAGVETEALKSIAGELKTALGVDGVRVMARGSAEGMDYTLTATVPGLRGGRARSVAQAFAATLTEKGYDARATVEPVREKVSGNVYAMVLNNVVSVEVSGRTDAEIEAEIVAQLTAAGVPNAVVDVNRSADGTMMEVSIQAESDNPDDVLAQPTDIVLTMDGEQPAGTVARAECKVMLQESASGGSQMVVEYGFDGGTATATVADPASLSDQDLAQAILDQLTAGGARDISVSVQDGRVSVLDMKDAGVMKSAEKATTWGSIKKDAAKEN